MFMFPLDRGKGYAASEMQQRLSEIKRLGYDYVICTVENNNTAQIITLGKLKWSFLSVFESQKTGHTVQLWGRQL